MYFVVNAVSTQVILIEITDKSENNEHRKLPNKTATTTALKQHPIPLKID